jgi:tetratricopeptide (TPR) repeat protein
MRARKTSAENVWELVHPRCARDRTDDLEEVQKMIEGGEAEIARDELLWLLNGCSDCLPAHKMLGEIALADHDLRLARGHFGYAFELGSKALDRAGGKGNLPYRLAANQAFFESGKALAYCLRELGKADLAADVVDRLLACDPSDPLGIRNLLDAPAQQSPAADSPPVDG